MFDDGVENLVKELSRNAVNSDDGLSMIPLVKTDRRGEGLRICSSISSGC